MPMYKVYLEWPEQMFSLGRHPFDVAMEGIHEDDAAQKAEDAYPGYEAVNVEDANE